MDITIFLKSIKIALYIMLSLIWGIGGFFLFVGSMVKLTVMAGELLQSNHMIVEVLHSMYTWMISSPLGLMGMAIFGIIGLFHLMYRAITLL